MDPEPGDVLTPTMEQVHAYLLATGWERRPDDPPGTQHWFNPPCADYPDDTMTLWDHEADPTNGGLLEILAADEGRCEHAILADILGRPDPATLLARIAELEEQLADANDELEFLRPRATGH